MNATCHSCGRPLNPGETVTAQDWTVVTPDGTRLVVRYWCEGCGTA